jgi:phytoene synthase
MADVVVRSTQPALAAIKLAWWRERLEELDEGKVPAEPRLERANQELLSRGLTGKMLAGLEDGWAALLEPEPDVRRAQERGARLFAMGARLLGVNKGSIDNEGRLFAQIDLSRRGIALIDNPQDALVIGLTPRRARPMTAFAALAKRDVRQGGPPFEAEATPGRAWTLLRHRITGRY